MSLERVALVLILVGCAVWLGMMLVGAIAMGPFAFVILVPLAAAGYLIYRVVQDRLTNREDAYYDQFDQ